MLTSEQKKLIALSSLGGALEFYDFILFIFLAKLLGKLFFPATNPYASLMAGLAVFTIGYLARPLGGIIFGHFGDRFGRKKTFIASVLLMAVPTFLIGLLPTYHSAGILASILLVTLRLLQGLSVGGELPGASVFIGETVAQNRRALATALIMFGVNMGMVTGSLVSALITRIFTEQELMSWGWRLPFFFGGLLGLLSYYLRLRMQETPVFKLLLAAETHVKLPIKEVFARYPLQVLRGSAITMLEAVIVSLIFLFMPTYLETFFHFPLPELLAFNTISLLIFSFPAVLMGYLSDRVGRKKIMGIGILCFIFFTYPLFSLFQQHDFNLVILVITLCALFGSCVAGVFPCMTVELFPTEVRYSGSAITYNLGFGIFGGLTPLIVTSLIHWTGNNLIAAAYLSVVAVIAFIALWFMRETYRVSLHDFHAHADGGDNDVQLRCQ